MSNSNRGRGRGKKPSNQNKEYKPTGDKRESKDPTPKEDTMLAQNKEEVSETVQSEGKGEEAAPSKMILHIQPEDLKKSMEREKQQLSVSFLSRSRSDDADCCICTDPIEFYGLGSCNHRDMCGTCALRRRVLYKDMTCPICRLPLENIVITGDKTKPYEQLDLKELSFYRDAQCFYQNHEPHWEKVSKLWENRCPLCEKTALFSTVALLKKHLKQDHQKQFCEVCLDHRKAFLQEQKIYGTKDLDKHLKVGDKDTLIIHEECKFCKKYFFDKDDIFKHMQNDHVTCFICEKNGFLYQYYKDYPELRNHYKTDHYPCDHPRCLNDKHIVFNSEMELKMHEVEAHMEKLSKSEKKTASKLFSLRGSSVSSMAPDVSMEPSTPSHAPPSVHSQEAFPSLGEQNRMTGSLNASQWGPSRLSNPESFPSLGPAPSAPNSSPSGAWGRQPLNTSTPAPSVPEPQQPKSKIVHIGSLPINRKKGRK